MEARNPCCSKHRQALFPGKSCFPLSAENSLAYSDPFDQLNTIFNVIGTPSKGDLECVDNIRSRHYLQELESKPAINLYKRFPIADPNAIDLLNKLLCFNPTKRITAAQALKHPYLSQMHNNNNISKLSYNSNEYMKLKHEFDWEQKNLTKDQLTQLILQELSTS